ncbi:MAG: acyl-CoA thioesterase [Phycisphaerae bacterium]|nr:acyl-CoA thioesterase [Phycisphaerae bacterium]
MAQSYRHRFRVRLDDVDYVHVLYFPRQVHFFMTALEDFFREALGIPWNEMIDGDGLAIPTANINVTYRAPLRFGDEAEIALSVIRIGERSVVIRYEVTNLRSGSQTCHAEQSLVFISTATWRPVPVPEKYRRALQPFVREPV